MKILSDARRVANHFLSSEVTIIHSHEYCFKDHFGAVLGDTCLQPGLRYNSVVFPRVKSIATNFPLANTSSGILETLNEIPASDFLNIKNKRKIHAFCETVNLFNNDGVEDYRDLQSWIVKEKHQKSLLAVHGFGNKSLDYLSKLIGLNCIALDRHLLNFAQQAGIRQTSYGYISKVLSITSQLLGLSEADLDISLWTFMSGNDIQLEFAFDS